MHSILRRWQDAEIDYAWTLALDENERSEITVARYENSLLLFGDAEQFCIFRVCHAKLSHADNIMPKRNQKICGDRIHVLVGEKVHGIVAK